MSKRWKDKERDVAKKFNARRVYLSGGIHQDGDVLHDELYIEVKYRKEWAIFSLFSEVERLAKDRNKIPLLVLSKKYDRDYIIVCRLGDVKEIAKHLQ